MTEQNPSETFQADQAEAASRDDQMFRAHRDRAEAEVEQVASWACRNMMAAHMWKAVGDLIQAVRLGVLIVALAYAASLVLGVFL